jgi:hypothetical protein
MNTQLVTVAAITIGLTGCQATIYRNDVVDATSESRTVSIRPMPAKNSVFRLFRVGDEAVGLVPIRYSGPTVSVHELHTALIFAPNDFEELRNACARMVHALNNKQVQGIDFIQYELVSNTEETIGRGKAVVTPYGARSEYESRTGRRILFELQLMKDAQNSLGPHATYSFRGVSGSLSIDNLKKLSEDLQQK